MIQRLLFLIHLAVFISVSFASNAQYQVSGRVVDGATREPMPFVNIIINNSHHGGTTDIDGKFLFRYSSPITSLRLSFVGYQPQTVKVGSKTRDLAVQMVKKEIDLQEVEILPGVNPAHRIIRNVIDNRDRNDPEKIQTFSYTAYDKTLFTLDNDTLLSDDFSALIDTSGTAPGEAAVSFSVSMDSAVMDSARADSANRLIENLINRQYLFLMENVTKRKFMAPDKNYNNVIATKMSGFKDPIFVFLTTQIQSFSFYKPFISIVMKNYVNPIGSGGLTKYFFKIEDTTYSDRDTVFIISFRPRKGTNFDGLKGLFYINTNGWAIQNVKAEPYGDNEGIRIRIHQMYELIDGRQWFPVQLNTDLAFNNLQVGKYKAVGRGRSYIRDIVLNPELVRREFNHLDTEVEAAATERNEQFWEAYRIDSLTRKDRETYRVLDSIGKAENFDRMAKGLQTILTGRIPWGPIDININKILNYNTYEGLVAGIGLHTNDRLADWFSIGGYFQYAMAILEPKYGGDVRFLVNRRRDLTFSASFYHDLIESGGIRFNHDPSSILSGDFRTLMLKKLDLTEEISVSTGFRLFKYMLFNIGLTRSTKQSTTFDLATPEGNALLLEDYFRFSSLTAGFKWSYGEKFIQTAKNKISLGTRFPVVWFQYTRGLKGFLDGAYDYDRIDLKINKIFNIKYLGKLTVNFQAGYVNKPVPACNLYYAPSSYRMVALFAPLSFGTMRSNEFLSNKFVSMFLFHDFGYLLFKGKNWFHPEFAVSQNIGFGWLDHKERYQAMQNQPREMDLGYFESGLLVNNLLNLRLYKVGAGVFYRWGPYSLDKTGDNFGYKISLVFPL